MGTKPLVPLIAGQRKLLLRFWLLNDLTLMVTMNKQSTDFKKTWKRIVNQWISSNTSKTKTLWIVIILRGKNYDSYFFIQKKKSHLFLLSNSTTLCLTPETSTVAYLPLLNLSHISSRKLGSAQVKCKLSFTLENSHQLINRTIINGNSFFLY